VTVTSVETTQVDSARLDGSTSSDERRTGQTAALDPADVAAVADMIAPAISAAATLVAQGRPVSRETMSDKLRDEGFAMSNARASTLVKIVRARPMSSAADDESTLVDQEPVVQRAL
jgi:hypothetical protein